ncbi:MAG: AbrB/MazE/SpoVT family DNA-binding domain-containing protein [Candidatus Bathyarchaeota archaeon]|nr:AbrB/MazE/SpoVT family DNA-binding domain-containing protein [Candidatus Bathyarchaeota archaeon]
MIETVESRVGSKGELFPPKEIREKLGLKPNTRILYRISEGKLVVEPVPDLEELMSREPVAVISVDEFREDRTELSRKVER